VARAVSTRAAPAPPREHPRPVPGDGFAARAGVGRALWVALAVLAATTAVNARFIATYAVRGDDSALLLHSARFFPVSPAGWLTRGFGDYFRNFPEATREYTLFLRPTVNLSVWLESWLAPSPNSPAFLLTNYLGHALCAAMVFLLARWMVRLPARAAVLAAALFAGSAAALDVFHSPAFRGDMLGAFWGMAGLLLAHASLGSRRRGAWLAASFAALLLAVFAKETAITAPFIAAAWVFREMRSGGSPARDRSGAWWAALLLVSPAFIYIIAKITLQGGGGAYATASGLPRNAAQTLSSAFFPGGGAFELRALPGIAGMPTVDGARMALAVLLSGAAWLIFAWRWRRRERDPRVLALALATGGPRWGSPCCWRPSRG
jgi:hypothetical protein